MARQSALGLILDTHLRTPLARVNWPYLTGRLLAHPWEVLLLRIRVEGGLRNSRRWRWGQVSQFRLRALATAQANFWRSARREARFQRRALRVLRGLILAAGGRQWTRNFLARPALEQE